MAKVRILQASYIPALSKVVNYNDEIEIDNEKLVDSLVKNGYADVLIEPKTEAKPAKKAQKSAKKVVEKYA